MVINKKASKISKVFVSSSYELASTFAFASIVYTNIRLSIIYTNIRLRKPVDNICFIFMKSSFNNSYHARNLYRFI